MSISVRKRLTALVVGASLTGCAAMQDYTYNYMQKSRADKAWTQCYGRFSRAQGTDFRDGWKQGYYDISTGACHEPPPVPPHQYWAASYQCEEGRAAIDSWYAGWQEGANAAAGTGIAGYHEVVSAHGDQGGQVHTGQIDGGSPLAARVTQPPVSTARLPVRLPQPPAPQDLSVPDPLGEGELKSPNLGSTERLSYEQSSDSAAPQAVELESGGAVGSLSDDSE